MVNKDYKSLGIRFGITLVLLSGLLGVLPVMPVAAATITVTNTNGSGAGSLRQAIADAVSGDTITFDSSLSGQTIGLSTTLIINKNLTIDGSALASRISISGKDLVRVLFVGRDVVVTIGSLIIKEGKTTGYDGGGGIYNSGILTVTDSVFFANNSQYDPFVVGGGAGGAILSSFGTLTITSSIFNGNNAKRGGAIFCEAGTMSIANTYYVSNTAADLIEAGDGGAIYNTCALSIVNTTFSANSASHYGGAILSDNDTNPLIITNSTFYENSAVKDAGGIANYGGLIISNSTFSKNNSPRGSAINNGLGGVLSLRNSILANSVGGVDCIKSDSTPEIESINNLIETTGIGFESCGTPLLSSDPMLGGLANNGGITPTMALGAGSPAIDAGNDATCPATDQRGVIRPFGRHCDIGAYEASPPTIVGNAGVAGVTLAYTDNGPKSVLADGSGNYTITVPFGWTGTVTPKKIGYQFTPASKSYSNVQLNQTAQNYTASACSSCADKDTVGVFRPSNGALYLRNLNVTGFADVAINYGLGGDYPVVGDWDGNGTDTIGVYRNGVFYLRNSNSLGFADITVAFGSPGDQPIAGDWNNDGFDTIGVYRSSTGTFLLRNTNTPGAPDLSFALGNAGDVGIAGDWDGDGMDTTGVFRPSNGVIFLKNTNTSGFANIALNYGLPGDQPVVGDWDNNGTTTIGIYRNGRFYLRNFNTNGFANIILDLGNVGDMPIAGNWDNLP